MSGEAATPVRKIRNRKKVIRKPLLGVKEDFEALIQKFVESGSVRYEAFAKIWKEMKMSVIQCGRQTHQETREFLEDIFMIAMTYYLPAYSFQVRTGGLYIMYGLYSTQYCVPSVKFRVTMEMWKDMLDYQKEAYSQQHFDIDFVFQSLKSSHAFHFVATKKEMYLKNSSIVAVPRDLAYSEVEKVDQSNLNSVVSTDDIRQLTAVDFQYQQLKIALAGPNAKKPDISLAVIQDNIVESITSTLQQHQERLNKLRKKARKCDKSQSNIEHAEQSEEEQEEETETTGSRRARLREKAFSGGTGSQRGKKDIFKQKTASTSETSNMIPIGVVVESEEDVNKHQDTPDAYISMPDFGNTASPTKIKPLTTKSTKDIAQSPGGSSEKDEEDVTDSKSISTKKNKRKDSCTQNSAISPQNTADNIASTKNISKKSKPNRTKKTKSKKKK